MPPIDESFWSEETVMPSSNSWTVSNDHHQYQFDSVETFQQHSFGYNGSNFDDGMDFWYDIFIRSGESIELPDFWSFFHQRVLLNLAGRKIIKNNNNNILAN